MNTTITLKKQRLKALNQRLAQRTVDVDVKSSLELLMEKVNQIRLEADFMVLKQQCKQVPSSPKKNRNRDVIEKNPCLQSIEIASPMSLRREFEHCFFASTPVKNSHSLSLSPKAKSSPKEKFSPYSPIGMSR